MARAPSQGSRAGGQPIETELKLAVDARDLPALRKRLARFGAGETVKVDNTYFDTAGRLLQRHRMGLRLRRIGRRWVQTLKTEAAMQALASRGEWEVPAPRGRLDVLRFPETPLAPLLRAHPDSPLRPVFRTRFARTLWRADGGAVEIVLDRGEIVAGERRAPLLEVELELKSGAADALFAIARSLLGRRAQALALVPAVESKAMRGYRLADGTSLQPAKANARAVVGDLARDVSLAAVLRRVIGRGTGLLLANAGGCLESTDPEFVHQARVAVRRMRSAARLIGTAAGWPAKLDAELRWVGRALGALRDWDVLQAQTLPALSGAAPAAGTGLAAAVAERRQRDAASLHASLRGPRFAALALRLLEWAHSAGTEEAILAATARKLLRRLHRGLFEDAAFFASLQVHAQHRVRIRAKRLRYALDLFAAALPAKATSRYVEQLARVQDELGALNDAVVAAERLPALARAARVDPAPALAWLDAQRQQHALAAEAALAALSRLPRPWARGGRGS